MKPWDELTRLGRLRRFRQLAGAALDAYGLSGAQCNFIHWAGNTLYRVIAPDPGAALAAGDRFVPGHYMLRIHEPGYQPSEGIEMELSWLAAMSRDAHLPLPEPVPALDGKLLVHLSVPGLPGARACSLLRWVKGRPVTRGIGPQHFKAQGRLMARMHEFAAGWVHPPGLTKRCWDADAFFRDVEGTERTGADLWPLLPRRYQDPFSAIAEQARAVMDAWGTGPDVYGLIHADLGVDANLLFWRGEARAIDFDDSGFGYWIYDLAIGLEHARDTEAYERSRDALFDGYGEVRTLPAGQVAQLELFLATWYVYVSLWCVAMAETHPRHREALFERMERAAGLAANYAGSA